jgi:hypothetical protein
MNTSHDITTTLDLCEVAAALISTELKFATVAVSSQQPATAVYRLIRKHLNTQLAALSSTPAAKPNLLPASYTELRDLGKEPAHAA